MAKQPKYDKGIYNKDNEEKSQLSPEKIANKLHKEKLTLEELAIYLNKFGNNTDELGNVKPVTSKTLKNYISRVCEENADILKKHNFMENDVYVIRPELHGLLLTLIDTDYFDGRINSRLLSNRDSLYRGIIENVEKYLSNEDKVIVKNNPAYLNALLESELSIRINRELTHIIRQLYHLDQIARYSAMKYFLEELVRLRRWLNKIDVHMFSTKLVYGHEVEEISEAAGKNGKIQKGLFQADSIESFLMKLIAHKAIETDLEPEESEELLTYPVFLASQILYNIEIKDETEAKVELDKIDKTICNDDKYIAINTKAKEILDLEDPYESIIYLQLMNLCKVYYLSPVLNPAEYEKTVKFTQSAMADDMWDVLNKLWNSEPKNRKQQKNRHKKKEFREGTKQKIYNDR